MIQKRGFGKLVAVLAAVLFMTLPAHAFDEGIDYKTLEQKQDTETGEKIEVLELFWYGCPHCYHLEPNLERWLADKPDYVEFRRVPAVLGRGWVNHARAYFAAEMLGVLDRLHIPFFSALHDQKRRLFDEDSIADWFADQGVNREEFLRAYKSFIVDVKVRRSVSYGQRVALDGVPAFVVNGRYLTSPSITAGSSRMFQVLDYLAAREAGMDVDEGGEDQADSDAEATDSVEQAGVAADQAAKN